MALRDARRLYDIAVRLQVYIEAVKVNQTLEFSETLAEVDREFKKLLLKVNYPTLDALSKAELNRLVMSLRKSQSKIYSAYVAKLTKQLQQFMDATLVNNKVALVSGFAWQQSKTDDEGYLPTENAANEFIEEHNNSNALIAVFGLAAILQGGSLLWGKIANEPIGANGVLLNSFLRSFSTSAQISTENLLRKAYANGLSANQASQELAVALKKISNQADAVIATAMQHIAANVSTAVQSALFPKYRWISVIDSGTTQICFSRNGKVYVFGKGPVPPAHIRCRSVIIPYQGSHDNETFYSWIKRQPNRIQNVALGNKVAAMLRDGSIKDKDLVRLANPTALTIVQFRKAIIEILTGKAP